MRELGGKEVFGWLDECGELRLKVQGSSMTPFLRGGEDTVILTKPENIKKGDVVVFERNGCYIMHRVIALKDGFIDTLGDNMLTPETHIPVENVVAVASGAIRKGKEISTKSLAWQFFSRIYINPEVRKIILKLRG